MVLQGPEAHHLAVVCRLRADDLVYLFNGDGQQYQAVIREVAKRSVVLEILAVEQPVRELPFPLHVALPLPKGDRAQFVVEKLTELGVTCLTPLRTARSVVHPREEKLHKAERWVIEACKQCGRNRLMEIAPLMDWDCYCRRADLPALRWLAHPDPAQATRLSEETARWLHLSPRDGVALAVGPEGGFSPAEIETARSAGWRLLHLGPRMLRVETAAIGLAAWTAWSLGS